jgi:putative transposase
MTSGLRRERHTVSDLKIHLISKIHLICVTKYRRKIFTYESLELIHTSFINDSHKMDFNVLKFNCESEHIYVLLEYPPRLSISQIVNSLKGVFSRRYGQAGYPKTDRKDALWSPSYFVSSVGCVPIEVLKKYIQNQENPSF